MLQQLFIFRDFDEFGGFSAPKSSPVPHLSPTSHLIASLRSASVVSYNAKRRAARKVYLQYGFFRADHHARWRIKNKIPAAFPQIDRWWLLFFPKRYFVWGTPPSKDCRARTEEGRAAQRRPPTAISGRRNGQKTGAGGVVPDGGRF